MSAKGIVAVVPMKPLSQSKTRLAGVLSQRERAALSLAMFGRVVAAAQDALGAVWVVGGDETVRKTAERIGAVWHEDPGDTISMTLSPSRSTKPARMNCPQSTCPPTCHS